MASIRLFVTVVFVFLGILPTTSKLLIAQNQPNFLWIMSEDNSKHYLKLFDPSGAETPNIANLAKQGVAFDRAFSNAPVCSVARTTLITMVYGPRLGTQFHRRTELAKLPDDWKMFPAYLRDAGYYTTNNSKKDYNAVETNGTWDASSNKAHWRNRPDGKPFFHVQTYTDSHESSLHFKQSWLDAPNNKTDPDSLELAPYHPDTPLFRLTYARYHDRIKSIDNRVGQLVEQLESDGLLENTFIFYFGDHGGVLPRGKGYIYESGLHVPLVVRVPQKWKSLSPFGRGTRTDGFVDFVDFGPTVLKLAGLTVPSFVDGEPFLGSGVTQNEVEARNRTLGYADRMDEKYDFCRSIRLGNWKYIRNYQAIYPDGLQNNYRYINLAWKQWRELFNSEKLNPAQSAFFLPKPAEQLFLLTDDPHEINNLSEKPEHRERLVAMRNELTNQVKAMPDLSFIPESTLVEEAMDNPISYGLEKKTAISRYVDIANLALLPVAEALPRLRRAISSQDPIDRYWAFSVCSILGDKAGALSPLAKLAVAQDADLLVKLRACEFLGIQKIQNPVPAITAILKESDSGVVNLIALQSLVWFQDGPFDYEIALDSDSIKTIDLQVLRRVGYLEGLPESEIKQRSKALMKRLRK
ncbi:MAG: sulfatase-like hydrolase/transferase [Mariniblastus sp.]|nr:sulfatase-like hydrolase/transferase [Mariniblastus sp.]